ncbi:hypothetical protein BOX15_Mlig005991g2 [Macrostomum lignano]|uniref:Uncharacterized protein n=1 Tax=Macrostomum lignano TaxID=282301 RepID=A0A267FJV6_9PLAT|nr:hypothetical protein BOX15_Mlig004172g2 [Macrostomum lignano]PAA73494.1 hypothetical protein BOX15_Mlig004172g1 [Macrostomum lignano]PAA91715.1 hypothetical protein BOX15_Mlig005991g2 [Macrostomum lignano]
MPLILRAKVIVVGDSTAGKSSLVQMFHSDGQHFPKNYSMTTGVELVVKSCMLPQTQGDQVEMYLYDCAGKDAYSDVVEKYVQKPDLCILVYDVTSEASFSRCAQWLAKLPKLGRSGAVPTALVANKSDLDNRRIVTASQGQEMAQNNGLLYFEASAKEAHGVDAPFIELAKKYAELYAERCSQMTEIASSGRA